MDRASSLIFPGSKTLAGWWRQLAPRQPQALAIGYAFLHRIEAPVQVRQSRPVEPLIQLLLQAITLDGPAGALTSDLPPRLGFPPAVVQNFLIAMQRDGLLARSGDQWQPTERGQQARDAGTVPEQAQQRRVFTFLEHMDPIGQRLGAPHFVPITECVGVPWTVNGVHRFDIGALKQCIEKPAEWKQLTGFPLDVEAVADHADTEGWPTVVVDRPERVLLAVIRVGEKGASQTHGYAVKVDGWTLFEKTPILKTADALPGSDSAPPMSVWQEAWRSWCKQRQLPANEVEACMLAYHAPRLEVTAPTRLMQRLQAAKSDLFKGDAWLLVGEGYMRTAAQMTVRT
ncbi:MAG: hypothetical protein FJ303_15775 [Planctomycetes bacterium]|nr:hypothetical protein [Planctomycetota bacterium]